ncbi:hypothetical protein ACD591_08740 [Rufibacter glacialis]|uniref:Uncharacterized protein n=1 Tax=Rufibacter glacialis TaxID=1259555 RepID=A0A5M8QBZ2_9BACT|nr:hypothetical protein [Rufibacter glacialis]KAA6432474.1 hypothetical protein FOE74_15365 [Rufibacter glacialis]GGK78954.1 hypothetical protein GCM10011405_28560 [Rufibacter glacialis]
MQVTEKLKTYYHYYQDLKEKGGPEENTELFESVVELEEDIMSVFGLPPSHTHLQILWQLTEAVPLSEEAIEETEQQLREAATEHLMAPVKTDLEVLLEAKTEKLSAFNVLPEIGQPTHDYPIFLFEEMLLKSRATPEQVLQEMEKVKELDCYGEVATLLYNHRKSFRKTKIYKKLKPQLQFLDTYLLQLQALGDSSEHSIFVSSLFQREDKDAQLLAQLAALPEIDLPQEDNIDPSTYCPESILLADTLEIEKIVYGEDTAVTVNGLLHTGTVRKRISLGFEFEDLYALFTHYLGHDQQVLPPAPQNPSSAASDTPVVVMLEDATGCTLLVDQHTFKVYKPLVLGEDGTHQIMQEEFYLVEEVLPKGAMDKDPAEVSQKKLHTLFGQLTSGYQKYLTSYEAGLSEREARQVSGLDHPVLFELAQHLHTLQQLGNQPGLK